MSSHPSHSAVDLGRKRVVEVESLPERTNNNAADAARTRSSTSSSRIVLSWGVSRKAIGELAPEGTSLLVHLECRIDLSDSNSINESRCTIRWALTDPADRSPGDPTSMNSLFYEGTAQSVSNADWVHFSSPVISASMRATTNDEYQLVYSKTDIFQQLQIAGGRYLPIGCSIQSG
jgi:hypothetical protein